MRHAELTQFVDDVSASFDPAFVFKRGYRSALRQFGLLIGDVEHGLHIDAHAVHIQTLSLREVDEVELDRADLVLILHLEVEPLMVPSSVGIHPHIAVVFARLHLDYHV